MHSKNLFTEINDLVLRGSDDRLSPDELNRLNELLATSDEACRVLLFSRALDADLSVHACEEAAQDRALEVITAEAVGAEYESSMMRSPHRQVPGLSRWVLWPAVACLALILGLVIFSRREVAPAANLAKRVPQPVGSLKAAPEAKFAGHAPQARDAFFEGDLVRLVSGEAHVSMASGVEFVLQGPAELKFDSANHVQLFKGLLTAHVATWGSGFTVDTSAMRVVDLGTRFVVSASTDDVETHVLQGKIRVQPLASTLSGRRSVLLTKGEGLRVDNGADEAVRFAAPKERPSQSPEKFWPFKPITLCNSGIGLAEGDEDPHWRITNGPKGGSYDKPQFAVVCEPNERYASNEPLRSQWLSFAKDVLPGGLANSTFTFETTFDLTGFDPSTVMLAAQILADNGIRALRINGKSVPIIPWDDNVPMQTFNSDQFRMVEIREGFVPGKNKIEIDVWNGTYRSRGLEKSPNPMALRVEFQGFGRLDNQRELAAAASR